MYRVMWPQAGAAEKDIPLYKHLAELAGNSKLVALTPPSPVIYLVSLIESQILPLD